MAAATGETYDLVLVGTGFASSFFLMRFLERSTSSSRVLVLERGERRDHSWQLRNPGALLEAGEATFRNTNPSKPWSFSIGFGGGSNCWWACTPRPMPNDLRLHSTYGVGDDWPFGYDDIEPYLSTSEQIMQVAGPDNSALFPRSRPYPLPAHRLSDPDRLLERAHPGTFFAQPTARPSRAIPGGRPRCCASGVCGLCPIDSKFTIQNSLSRPYDDPRVDTVFGAEVRAVDLEAGRARGVHYVAAERPLEARGELVALGANAMFNAAILLRSGFDHPLLGRRLFEQASYLVTVLLDGIDNFQGSTSVTGNAYGLYDGEHRRIRPAALVETHNMPQLRSERGRQRQLLQLKVILEDLPQPENRVAIDRESDVPIVHFAGRSEYVTSGRAKVDEALVHFLEPLPTERVILPGDFAKTESHLLGTVVMGNDPTSSIVDAGLVHHRVRNLLVLGGSAFPTAPPANPTLTISALSLWAADRLLS